MMFPWYIAIGVVLFTAWLALRVGGGFGVGLFLVVLIAMVYVQDVESNSECVDYGHAAREC